MPGTASLLDLVSGRLGHEWGTPDARARLCDDLSRWFEMGRPSSIGVQVLVCVTLFLATNGCGGGGSSATRSTTVPTRAQFERQLLALCPDSKHLIANQKAFTQAINADDLRKASKIVASTESTAGSFFRKFERLVPPAKDRVAFVRYLSLTHQYLGIDARVAAALRTHTVVEVHRFGGLAQKVSDRLTASAVGLGLRRCA